MNICLRFTRLSLTADKKRRGITDDTFQIGLVDPGFVWGGNPQNKIKRRDIYYSSDEEENNECSACYHQPPNCHYQPVPCDWKPCPPGCPKPKPTPIIPKRRYSHQKFPSAKISIPAKPTPPVCDECWWKPPCTPPCDYTPCPEECPPPEPICDECHWESPCEESDDDPCEWKPCPEICRPPKLKRVPSPCDECSWESPCESDDEPCEWQPCPEWCPPPAPQPPKVTQIWDGQVQAPCQPPGPCPLPPPPAPSYPQRPCPLPSRPKVTQIWDGQIQGPVYRPQPHHPLPPPSHPKVIQIWDGQIQAPHPQPWYKRMFKRDESKNYQRSEMAMP